MKDVTGSKIKPTNKSIVIDMIKTNKVDIFKCGSSSADGVNDMIDTSDNPTNYSHLDDWYNKADQTIGVYIDYFMVEVNATLEN